MRILVTGAAGMLGRPVAGRFAAAGHEVVGVDLPDGDLADAGVAGGLLAPRATRTGSSTAAAYTAVDRAETEHDRGLARQRRRHRAELGGACEAAGCPLTHISTDYVFAGDGRTGYDEDDPARSDQLVRCHQGPGRGSG